MSQLTINLTPRTLYKYTTTLLCHMYACFIKARLEFITLHTYFTISHKICSWICFLHCGYHYCDVILNAMTHQIAGVSIDNSTVCSGADQRTQQSPMLLSFVRGINRWPVDPTHKGSVTQKMFLFDDVIMFICFCWIMIFIHPQYSGSFTEPRAYHDEVIKWKHFWRNWPFVHGLHPLPVNSPHKGQ